MAETIVLTGVVSQDTITLNGVSGAQQITAIGVVAQQGPQGLTGPAGASADLSQVYKQLAADPDTLITGTITRDANEAAISAGVVWPDGSIGTYTATTVSSAFPGAVDAYTITYGSPVTVTYIQAPVTRDALGAVTNRPAITVS